jgi:predicted nicotinamide N-methyase/ribosomal protein L12E/L44/L45/RPP1/RPP2
MQDSDTVLPVVEAEKEWIEAPGGWGGGTADSTLTSTSTSTSTSIPSSSSPKEEDEKEDSDNDDDESSPFDLFANVDKSLKFPFDVLTKTTTMTTTTATKKVISNKKRLYLSGYKLDSDETAQSTGVTLWDAAPRLANYIMNHDNNDNNHEHNEQDEEQDEGKKEENENRNRNMNMLITGKRVLELGSGLGLCGIVAYHIGANYVMMTDADTITLEKMRYNVTQNCSPTTSTDTTTDTSDTTTDTTDTTTDTTDTSCGESGIATSSRTSRTSRTIDCKQLIWNEQLEIFHQKYGNWDTILGADVIYTRESLEPLFDTVVFFLLQHQLENKNQNENNNNNNNKLSSSSVVGRFILSRYNKWGDISDETVLDAAKARNLIWTKPSEGIFVFQLKIIK